MYYVSLKSTHLRTLPLECAPRTFTNINTNFITWPRNKKGNRKKKKKKHFWEEEKMWGNWESGDWVLFTVLILTDCVALERNHKTSVDLSFPILKIRRLWELVSVAWYCKSLCDSPSKLEHINVWGLGNTIQEPSREKVSQVHKAI